MASLDVTHTQSTLNNVLPRIGAGLSVISALYMIATILRSQFYCRRIYHRIMLGCSINVVVLAVNALWGPAAVPKNEYTDHIFGRHGTVATCSVQGFIYQFAFVVPFYYIALSIMSYAAVLTRFKIDRYDWIEKYIHLGVYIFPVGSAIYLLSVQGFNPAVRDCYIGNHPYECVPPSKATGEDDEVLCLRGPDNMEVLQLWLFGIPFLVVMLIPVIVMATLYWRVRNRSKSKEIAKSVAIQCGVYLLALYWTYLFRLIGGFSVLVTGRTNMSINILANFVECCQGVWILMAYLYFRSDDPTKVNSGSNFLANIGLSIGFGSSRLASRSLSRSFKMDPKAIFDDDGNEDTVTKTTRTCPSSMRDSNPPELPPSLNRMSSTIHVNDTGLSIREPNNNNTNNNNNNSRGSGFFNSQSFKPQFSIFDGFSVDSGSPWAAFLQDDVGEDDDYQDTCEYDDTENFVLGTGEASRSTSEPNIYTGRPNRRSYVKSDEFKEASGQIKKETSPKNQNDAPRLSMSSSSSSAASSPPSISSLSSPGGGRQPPSTTTLEGISENSASETQ